jgi:pantoate--beta-alanine ligase
MGALHEGHLSLVAHSQEACDFTLVTIFVNPTQFGANEDFSRYPRTLPRDLEQLRERDVDLVFAPDATEMYAKGFSTYVEPPAVSRRWEGECRPGHFRGVATIVLKLFLQAQADLALFGAKDFQQARVIQRMSLDLDIPTEVRVCPTIREPDGLAMSSRNRYLSAEERARALALSQGLMTAEAMVAQGERDAGKLVAAIRERLAAAAITDIDYVAVVDPDTLEPIRQVAGSARALIAARVGSTRLIDNCELKGNADLPPRA